ncbi:MAG: hypothetical protein FWE40_09835 [Oscillospiraceae bacterium]|nr:hypothetical protein [Oscillospiraceae bacterium]
MNLHNMKLPAQLEELARWLAEDGHEEDALDSYLTGHNPNPVFRAAPIAPAAPPKSSLYDFDFAPMTAPDITIPQRFELPEYTEKKTDSVSSGVKNRKGLRVLTKVGCGVVASLLVFVLALITLPRLFGVGMFVQHDDNMLPRFAAGTISVYRQRPFEEIPNNADIVFATSETYMQSRVIRRDSVQGMFITQCLNAQQSSAFVYHLNVRGQILFGIPLLGYVVQWLLPVLNQAIAAAALFALLAVLILLDRKLKKPAEPKDAAANEILDDNFFATLGMA